MVLEQHFLISTDKFNNLLSSIDLSNHNIIEFGVGTGILTSCILTHAKVSTNLLGYEIDPSLCNIKHNNFTLKILDINLEDFKFLKEKKYSIICTPPYSLLLLIRKLIDSFFINDVIIMVSEKYLSFFPEFKICFILNGNDFYPLSSGKHFVIKKGFNEY